MHTDPAHVVLFRARPATALATALLAAALSGQTPIPPQSIAVTALSAGARTSFPDASGDFEYSVIGPGQFLYGTQFPGGTTAWTPWTMGNGTGIASNGSGFTGQNPNAPQTGVIPGGTRVAFVQGNGTMSTPYTFARGIWRLRFQAAQRKQQGVANRQVLRISIGGTEVFEQELSGTDYAGYLTRAIRFPVVTQATVTFQGLNPYGGDNTAFVDKVELEPIRDWQVAASWSPAHVPDAFTDVLIPNDVEVAMTGSLHAATVTVHGELLSTFESSALETRWLMVSNPGARFEVGRELTPFAASFELALIGNDPNENVMGAGTKFLMAMDGGTVDLHGLDKRSWTKLNAIQTHPPSAPSPWSIQVDDRAGWQIGDQLVIAYTGYVSHYAGLTPGGACTVAPYTGPRSQKRTIVAIDPVTGDLYLDAGLLAADHCTAPPTTHQDPASNQTWVLDERAEVGALSRNVRIHGSATGTFGAHVMIMACCDNMPTGFARIANVEMTEMGQQQMLGRYPMHWHMVRGSGSGQYLRNSAIHHSYNRAITVHGSYAVHVEDNVCFDVLGHAVFLEDGVEHDNVFTGNLVLATQKPADCAAMLPHDNAFDQPQNRSPASFWISNPANYFVGNVAADSLGVGYWFALHRFPTGTSTKLPWSALPEFQNVQPILNDLGAFVGNTAHSLKMAIDLHDSVRDGVGMHNMQLPCDAPPSTYCVPPPPAATPDNPRDDDIETNALWQPTNPATLSGLRAFGCATGIYTGGGVQYLPKITFSDCVLADNGVHVQMASSDAVRNSILIYDGGNMIYPVGNQDPFPFTHGNAYNVYDGPASMHDCYLVGYANAPSGALIYTDFGAARRHPNHLFSGISYSGGVMPSMGLRDFTNPLTPVALAQPNVWGIAIVDQDGTLCGGLAPGYTLISNHPMMHLDDGTGQTVDKQVDATAWLSPMTWGHLQVRYYDGAQMNQLLELNAVPPATFVREPFHGGAYTFPQTVFASTLLPSAQMRQLPVIVGPNGAPVCTYTVILGLSANPNLHRVDVSIDDSATGNAIELFVQHSNPPANWSPTLYINDNPTLIHANGQHPSQLTPLVPGLQNGVTSFAMTTIGGKPVIDLRMVNPTGPVPLGRTHRVTITW